MREVRPYFLHGRQQNVVDGTLELEIQKQLSYLQQQMSATKQSFGAFVRTFADGTQVQFIANLNGPTPLLIARLLRVGSGRGGAREEEEEIGCGFIYSPRSDENPNSIDPPGEFAAFFEYYHNFLEFAEDQTIVFLEDYQLKSAGNVDWISEDAEHIVSFWGPLSRYFYWTGYVIPGAPGNPWDVEYKPPNHIYYNGRLLLEVSGQVNGVGIFVDDTDPDNKKYWLLYTKYQNSSKFSADVSVYAAPLTLNYTPSGLFSGRVTAGDPQLILESSPLETTSPSWAFDHIWAPKTITAFNPKGTEGVFVLQSGDICTLTITPGTLAPDVELEITRYEPPNDGAVVYKSVSNAVCGKIYTSFDVFCCGIWANLGGGTRLTATGPEDWFNAVLEVNRCAADAVAAKSAYKAFYDNFFAPDTIPDIKIPLAADYLPDGTQVIAHTNGPNSVADGTFSIMTQSWSRPGCSAGSFPIAEQAVFSGSFSAAKVYLYMPDDSVYPLKETYDSAVYYQARKNPQAIGTCGNADQVSIEEERDKSEEGAQPKSGGCIRHLDLRYNSVYIAVSATEYNGDVNNHIYTPSPTPTLQDKTTYNSTSIIKTPMTLQLRDDVAPDWDFVLPAPTVVETNSSSAISIGWVYITPDPALLVLEAAPPVNTYPVSTSSIAKLFAPGELNQYLYFGGYDDGLNGSSSDAADPGGGQAEEIAYTCGGDRAFSLKGLENEPDALNFAWTGYWSNDVWTNQFWDVSAGENGEEVPWEPYVSLPETDTNIMLAELKPMRREREL